MPFIPHTDDDTREMLEAIGAESIDDFFGERGQPSYAYVIYMNLGDLYLDKERYVDAAETYEAFVNQDPHHPKAPLLQVDNLAEACRIAEEDPPRPDGLPAELGPEGEQLLDELLDLPPGASVTFTVTATAAMTMSPTTSRMI